MIYRIGIFLLLTMVVLGGCQIDNKSKETKKPSEMKKEDLPDVRAFNDEFTRDFLQSTEKTRKGYYPFVSGTGKFKLDFPAEGVIDERAYFEKKGGYEEFPIHIKDETGAEIHINYFSHHNKDNLDIFLDNFKENLSYDGDFKKREWVDRSLYYADFERNGFHTFGGHVQNEQAEGGIDISYEIDCRDDKKEVCRKNKETDNRKVMKWMESVQFINGGRRE